MGDRLAGVFLKGEKGTPAKIGRHGSLCAALLIMGVIVPVAPFKLQEGVSLWRQRAFLMRSRGILLQPGCPQRKMLLAAVAPRVLHWS